MKPDPSFCKSNCCAGRFIETKGCMSMSGRCDYPFEDDRPQKKGGKKILIFGEKK